MGIIKNLMIVFIFSFVVVGMIFWGVTIIEAKEKTKTAESVFNHDQPRTEVY